MRIYSYSSSRPAPSKLLLSNSRGPHSLPHCGAGRLTYLLGAAPLPPSLAAALGGLSWAFVTYSHMYVSSAPCVNLTIARFEVVTNVLCCLFLIWISAFALVSTQRARCIVLADTFR
jgi:hypothetical protein